MLEFALITWKPIVLNYACIQIAPVDKAKVCFLFQQIYPTNFSITFIQLANDVRDLNTNASLDQDLTPAWHWHHFLWRPYYTWITKITSIASLVEWVLIQLLMITQTSIKCLDHKVIVSRFHCYANKMQERFHCFDYYSSPILEGCYCFVLHINGYTDSLLGAPTVILNKVTCGYISN